MIVHFVTERSGIRENAGTSVSNQQMNPGTPRYPVDRYLVECSNKFEMVNIMGDDIWNAEPALRPEEEIILSKLHDMLQSTADDLKLLSGELSKYHEPGVQVKSLPTPLDEDFNEKVHIEEIVNAKFHGYKVVDKPTLSTSTEAHKDVIKGIIKTITTDVEKPKKVISTGTQVSQMLAQKRTSKKNNLAVTQTKVIQINDNVTNMDIDNKENKEIHREKVHKPSVAYNEISFENVEPKIKELQRKPLQIQIMPSINIRSELREQKVLDLNIEPEPVVSIENVTSKSNVAVISIEHKPVIIRKTISTKNDNQVQVPMTPIKTRNKESTRKVSKMSSCESSESNDSSKKIISNREAIIIERLPPKPQSESIKSRRGMDSKRDVARHSHSSLVEWRKKLNSVYGNPTSSRVSKLVKPERKCRTVKLKPTIPSSQQRIENQTVNNIEYIPYSKLTLGGVRVSVIEKQLSDIPNKNNIALSPILDKILSRENSFKNESPEEILEESPKILNTSEENLLQVVLDIEKDINKTLSKNFNEINVPFEKSQASKEVDDQDSYVDDFEDEKSDYSPLNDNQNPISDAQSKEMNSSKSINNNSDGGSVKSIEEKMLNKTFIKKINLSIKNKVDTFEFLHSVDTQEMGTQSNSTQKLSLKETQTSPRNDRGNIQPIYNDLWPTIDPKKEVEKLFQLEKELIKKLIVDEYGDLLEENLNKPSTSKEIECNIQKNVVSSQKNTQTSPAHMKSVMTSPTKYKTRTTSPFVSRMVDQQTSPLTIEEMKINVDDGDDLAISINLSSPRFSLRLPQTSEDVISNIESHFQSKNNRIKNITGEPRMFRKNAVSSSSSAEVDYSSSDISSIGEVRFKLKKRLQKLQVPSISELSSSTTHSKYSSDISDAIIPFCSEGEVSLGQINKRRSKKHHTSEGEMSVGRL